MVVKVNGEEIRLDEPASVEALIERFRLGGSPCAVEVNKTLVPHRQHASRILADGDVVEIVTLVGGG